MNAGVTSEMVASSSTSPAEVKRKPAARKPAGRKTASRFRKYAGGEESEELAAAASSGVPAQSNGDGDTGGITAALVGLAAADGQTVVQVPVYQTVPHPFNDPDRSKPQTGDPKWDELVNGARASGIKVPGLLVTREGFLAKRPDLAHAIGDDAEYVVIYGHRRRAAAIAAGLATIPAVIDDAVMDDHGDLDAMTLENLGRQDLSEIAEAQMFARYSELGLSQRAIAEKLGVDQATVSRRLSLLLLAPEVQAAIAEDAIRSAEGAALAGALPYGPARSWQKKGEPGQDTDARRSEQLAAFTLIAERGMSPTRAAERVLTERNSRAQALAAGLEIVDPRERFGASFHEHRLFDVSDVDFASADVVGAIDPGQGTLVYYAVDKPSDEVEDAAKLEAEARAAAVKARREAGIKLVATVPSREKLVTYFIDQYAYGVSALATSAEGWRLAQAYVRLEGLDATEFRVSAQNGDEKRRSEIAWACAVAGYELAAADGSREWGPSDLTYLDLLSERADYKPTAWEEARLDAARRALRVAE
ncbi:ParB/RepB/Spo0J family partition protein [Rhodococcus jostii]|uniref:Chromosome partitioning protein, ParB family n=1 Tax=Rhodococcus jostii TaxID=132919 RepID=A0A1H4IJB7_RHOJO|nr:ParB/RepB/Spo0J family partition protein [Rhodococcus jostii]SEB33756.1 chromosome partitioning protein, ParB family [Rhodococcus jostii]